MKPFIFKDVQLNNLLRGAHANTGAQARHKTINNARQVLKKDDANEFATIMCNGDLDEFYFGPAFPRSIATIYRTPYRRAVPLATECALQSARMRHYLHRLTEASSSLGRINTAILSGDLVNAAGLCDEFLKEFGFSATLARKALYLNLLATGQMEYEEAAIHKTRSTESLKPFFSKAAPRLYAQFINLTIDICDRDVECFDTMREHIRLLKESQATSEKFPPHYSMMRRILFPTNFHSIIDSVSLLYFSSSSAVDLLVDMCTASHFESPFSIELEELFSEQPFVEARENLQPSDESLSIFLELPHSQGPEQAAYRAAAIFPEVVAFARWRRALDLEFYIRNELPLPTEPDSCKYFPSKLRMVDLCEPQAKDLYTLSHFDNSASNSFLRTVAVLNRIRNGDRLSDLSADEIRVLLSQTTALSRVLGKNELIELRERSEREDADVIVFLAMVMLNDREPDEDLAFEMRMAFQMVVIRSHNSDIIQFLDWLHERTASLCPVVVDLCDIAFLERLYLLNASYSEVLSMRQQICRWTATKFGRQEYESIADRLALDTKVRLIREGIDETRIFVDVLRYKQWTLDALAPILRKFERVVSVAPVAISEKPHLVRRKRSSKEAPVGSADFWFYIASNRAFHEFCHNKLFGIDSYLSRRIRHGTLAGTLIVPIQEKISEFHSTHGIALVEADDLNTERVLATYRSIIARIRDDLLHFRSEVKLAGLFVPNADQTSTRTNLQADFRNRVVQFFHEGYSAPDVCPLFLDHCWDLLTEDLIRIQNELRKIFTTEVRPLLRSVSAGKRDVRWRYLATELDQTAEGLFSNLLRWFGKSEGSAMTVSVKELVTVVAEEVAQYFPSYQQKYRFVNGGDESLSGLTYQTVYDLLSLFFTNIAQHADPTAESSLWSEFTHLTASGSAMLEIRIISKNISTNSDAQVRKSIHEALANDDEGESMVREGNSGLGKARALIRANSGDGGFSWDEGVGKGLRTRGTSCLERTPAGERHRAGVPRSARARARCDAAQPVCGADWAMRVLRARALAGPT